MTRFCEACGTRIRGAERSCHACGRDLAPAHLRRTRAAEGADDIFGVHAAAFILCILWALLAARTMVVCPMLAIGVTMVLSVAAAPVPPRLRLGIVAGNLGPGAALLLAGAFDVPFSWTWAGICLVGALANAASWLVTRHPYRWIPPPGCCQTCGYNLTGLRDPRCPECGTPFEMKETPAAPDSTQGR